MSVSRSLVALSVLSVAAGCKPPPPAPEGLNASTSYMVREFYADDATFDAGVRGFMNWFDTEGEELVGLKASLDGDQEGTKPVDAFTVDDLAPDDVAALPLLSMLTTGDMANGNGGEPTPRDISTTAGVVSVAEMECSWREAEALLVRTDQNSVFNGDWEGYERTYRSDRATFEAASASEEYDVIAERIDLATYDPNTYAKSLLLTDNMVDPTPLLGVDIPSYPMALDLRHGRYMLEDGTEVGALAVLTYTVDAAWGPTGDNGLRQSFSIEINVEREGGKTLRMLAVWAEPVSPIIGADSAATLTYAVNKSQDSSARMSEVCAGEVEIVDEP